MGSPERPLEVEDFLSTIVDIGLSDIAAEVGIVPGPAASSSAHAEASSSGAAGSEIEASATSYAIGSPARPPISAMGSSTE